MAPASAPPKLLPNVYFHNDIVPLEKAQISIASHSLQYGTLCIGGMRGYVSGNEVKILRLKDHFDRMVNSTKILDMPIELDWDRFREIIVDLVKANAPTSDFYIRPMLYSENQELVPRFYNLTFNLAVYMLPLGHYYDPDQGLRMMISSWKKIADTAISTKAKAGGSYLNSAMAKTEAVKCGYDEALMMDDNGHVVEASVANILLSYRDLIFFPPLGSALLEGITRRTVIEFLKEDGIPIQFENIDRSMVYSANELLVTGTAAQVSFAQSVDGRSIGHGNTPGPLCKRLRQHLAALIAGQHKRSAEWLTYIPL